MSISFKWLRCAIHELNKKKNPSFPIPRGKKPYRYAAPSALNRPPIYIYECLEESPNASSVCVYVCVFPSGVCCVMPSC